MKSGRMVSKETLLDFGTIRKDACLESNEKIKDITLTVFSNTEWILLAKSNSGNSFFNSLFKDDSSPVSYSVKTKDYHTNNRFYPFIQDDYIIIASGEKTSNEGLELLISLRLNGLQSIKNGTHSTSIDFILLTKDRYIKKMDFVDNSYCSTERLAKTHA